MVLRRQTPVRVQKQKTKHLFNRLIQRNFSNFPAAKQSRFRIYWDIKRDEVESCDVLSQSQTAADCWLFSVTDTG